MKKVEAIIRPARFDDVKEALTHEGFVEMTISEVKGCAAGDAHLEMYRGAEYVVDLLPKIKIEVVVGDAVADRVVELIRRSARTGQRGDGATFVLPVEDAIRIGNGERML